MIDIQPPSRCPEFDSMEPDAQPHRGAAFEPTPAVAPSQSLGQLGAGGALVDADDAPDSPIVEQHGSWLIVAMRDGHGGYQGHAIGSAALRGYVTAGTLLQAFDAAVRLAGEMDAND